MNTRSFLSSDEDYLFSTEDAQRSVLFLDIDGVLQPDQSIHRYRFHIQKEDKGNLYPNAIADQTGIEHLRDLKWYDVAAVSLDWEEDAVSNLREILLGCGKKIEIVLSSSWRETKSLEDMKALFAVHNLDFFLTDMCPLDNFCSKRRAIELYLKEHPDLKDYVIVDDENLLADFPGHFVYCTDAFLTSRIRDQVLRIFRHGFWWEHLSTIQSSYYIDGYHSVIFLDIDGVLNADDGKSPSVDEHMVLNLARIIRDNEYRFRDKVEIVLSSSWRFSLRNWALDNFPKDKEREDCWQLFQTLAKYGLSVADITPAICSGPVGRPLEIRTWLSQHLDVKEYVILDDESHWIWDDLQNHVVKTAHPRGDGFHMDYGLTDTDAVQAKKILHRNIMQR